MKHGKLLAATLSLLIVAPLAAQSHPQHDKGQMDQGAMMKNTPANPYAEAEMGMHQRMMQAMGANPDQTFARKMIEHHRGASEMAQILAARGSDRELKQMAQRMRGEQERDMRELENWLRRHGGARR